MKILQISPFVPFPATNGGFLSVGGILKGLSQRGHEIDFVCFRKHHDYEKSYSELKKYCTPHILDVQTDNNIFDAIKNLFSYVPYNASKYQRQELLDFLERFFKEKDVDIVHIDHLHLGWVAKHIRKWTSAPIVLREQNVETIIMKRFAEKQTNPLLKFYANLQYKKFVKFEPAICKLFDKCVMISETDVKRIRELDKSLSPISIPAGVDEKLLKYQRKETLPFSLVHIGHLDWHPNYDGLNWFVNKVLPIVIKKFPETVLYVYGGGKTSDYVVPQKMKNHVKIIGFVENLWDEILNKSLAVVPLRIGSGIRLKILELLAVGVPILTTQIGLEGIDAEDNKHLLVANDENEFAEKIFNFFENKYDANSLIDNGKKFIEKNYTWDVIAERFENLYLDLLKGKE